MRESTTLVSGEKANRAGYVHARVKRGEEIEIRYIHSEARGVKLIKKGR